MYSSKVQEIHNEFYTSEERLLNEAKELINKPIEDQKKKAARIAKLGFGKAKPVKSVSDVESKREASCNLIKTIEYFRQQYPLNKFITESEVKRICEKYGLVFGDAGNYLGDIPEKNISEIEKFVLRKEDYVKKDLNLFSYSDYFEQLSRMMRSDNGAVGIITHLRNSGLQNLYNEYAIGIDPYAKPTKQANAELKKPEFKICAPKEDFNTSGYEVKEGYLLVYDPVVLQPVKDGYLIVTAWGTEASDEIVVNDKMN